MKLQPNDLYSKIEQLSKNSKAKLLDQGVVIPIKNKDGTISVGNYTIKRKKNGFYCILDFEKDVLIDNINLPQSAAVLANRLALGKFDNDDLIDTDVKYGYALFDEELHSKIAEKSIDLKLFDKADIMSMKSKISKQRKEEHLKTVMRSFNKLLRFN
jgi:hypothetical protein